MEFFGTIILACIAYFVVKAVWRSHKNTALTTRRRHEQARAAALKTLAEGAARRPSWAGNAESENMFYGAVKNQLEGKVEARKLDKLFEQDWFKASVQTIADAHETRGFAFLGQTVLTADVIEEMASKGLYERVVSTSSSATTEKTRPSDKQVQQIDDVDADEIVSDPNHPHRKKFEMFTELYDELFSHGSGPWDIYCYLMNECRYMNNKGGESRVAVLMSGIQPLEYADGYDRVVPDDTDRKIVHWLENTKMRSISLRTSPESAHEIRLLVFNAVLKEKREALTWVRLRSAVDHYNLCIDEADRDSALAWAKITEMLEEKTKEFEPEVEAT